LANFIEKPIRHGDAILLFERFPQWQLCCPDQLAGSGCGIGIDVASFLRFWAVAVGVRLDQAGVDDEVFTADQTFFKTAAAQSLQKYSVARRCCGNVHGDF
tara:strand:- start:80518 stop:80820 length:303 start_codon:yes stop_codon:yes gene_type:complete